MLTSYKEWLIREFDSYVVSTNDVSPINTYRQSVFTHDIKTPQYNWKNIEIKEALDSINKELDKIFAQPEPTTSKPDPVPQTEPFRRPMGKVWNQTIPEHYQLNEAISLSGIKAHIESVLKNLDDKLSSKPLTQQQINVQNEPKPSNPVNTDQEQSDKNHPEPPPEPEAVTPPPQSSASGSVITPRSKPIPSEDKIEMKSRLKKRVEANDKEVIDALKEIKQKILSPKMEKGDKNRILEILSKIEPSFPWRQIQQAKNFKEKIGSIILDLLPRETPPVKKQLSPYGNSYDDDYEKPWMIHKDHYEPKV